MADGIYTALSGAVAEERRVELLSHNLANVNTKGFQNFRMAMESVKGASDEMAFAIPSVMKADTRPGPIVATGNPLDLALTEGVHFAVRDGDTEGYVRGGTLTVTSQGTLATEEGYEVLGNKEVINVPKDAKLLQVGTDGTVLVDGQETDKIRLVEFEKPDSLEAGSGRIVYDSGNAGQKQIQSKQPVMPGYLEQANISAVQGMTELITAHRSYEAMTKMIETFSAVEKHAARDLSR